MYCNFIYAVATKYDKMEVQMNETIKYQNIHGDRKHKDSLFRKVFRKMKELILEMQLH